MKTATEKAAPIPYRFKNKTVKKAFQQYALQNETSIQQMITEALKANFKEVKQ